MKNLNICTLKEVPVKKKVTPKKKGKKPSYIYSWFIKLFLLHSFYIQICSRYYLRFFEQLPRQTLGWLNGNRHFLTLKGLWQVNARLWIWPWRSQNYCFERAVTKMHSWAKLGKVRQSWHVFKRDNKEAKLAKLVHISVYFQI